MGDPNPYATHGRHHRLNQQHTQARYHLRAGIARVALEAKVTGKPAEDSVGRPLLYANEMSQRHSAGQLEHWAKGKDESRTVIGVFAGIDFKCERCGRLKQRGKCGRCRHA